MSIPSDATGRAVAATDARETGRAGVIDLIEKWAFRLTRLSTATAIIASWLGAFLMFLLGIEHTIEAFSAFILRDPGSKVDLPVGDATVVHLIGALDRFLIGVVLLYFGYGLYGLFVRPDQSPKELGLPEWLHVDSIGELKQTLAEVIIVILFVLYLRVALETFHADGLELSIEMAAKLLVLPIAIALLAGSLKLAELNPKKAKNGRSARPYGSPDF